MYLQASQCRPLHKEAAREGMATGVLLHAKHESNEAVYHVSVYAEVGKVGKRGEHSLMFSPHCW